MKILRQHDVFDRGEEGNQVKLLKDESNFFRAHAIQVRGRDPGHILPVEPDLARRRPVEAADQIDQRRFTRSRRPHDRQPLALGHVQRDVVERVDRRVVFARPVARFLGGVELGHVLDLNHFTLPSE